MIVDEAHTSQSGKTATALKKVLTDGGQVTTDEEIDTQDVVNELVEADLTREKQIETVLAPDAAQLAWLLST